MKNMLMTLLVLGSLMMVLAACDTARGDAVTGNSGANGTIITVHADAMSFAQSSITLKTGERLELINDASDMHVVTLGTWQQGSAKARQEPGAPQVNNEQLNGNGSLVIGPWKTPGTYQLYCPVHMNMNLTVVVQ